MYLNLCVSRTTTRVSEARSTHCLQHTHIPNEKRSHISFEQVTNLVTQTRIDVNSENYGQMSMALIESRHRNDYIESRLKSIQKHEKNSNRAICGEIGHWYRNRKA